MRYVHHILPEGTFINCLLLYAVLPISSPVVLRFALFIM
jgi:hypothetical protein